MAQCIEMKTKHIQIQLHTNIKLLFIVTILPNIFLPCYCTNSSSYELLRADTYLWTLEPYVSVKNGSIRGMLHTYIQEVMRFEKQCFLGMEVEDYINIKHVYESREEFDRAFEKFEKRREKGLQKNTTCTNETRISYWFPILTLPKGSGAKVNEVVQSKEISILINKRYTSIPYKYINAYSHSSRILLIASIASVFVGSGFWLLEHRTNPNIRHRLFTIGSLKGMWWSVATMTSVGYGDLVPRNVVTKFFGVIWAITGVILASTLTTFATQSFSDPIINLSTDLIVGVVNGTIEETLMKEMMGRDIKTYETYEILIDVLKHNKDDISVVAMNSDIVAYKQTTWNSNTHPDQQICVVSKIPSEVPLYIARFGILESTNNQMKNCIISAKREATRMAIFKHRVQVKITTTNEKPVLQMIVENKILIGIVYAIFTALGFGIIFDMMTIVKQRNIIQFSPSQNEISATKDDQTHTNPCLTFINHTYNTDADYGFNQVNYSRRNNSSSDISNNSSSNMNHIYESISNFTNNETNKCKQHHYEEIYVNNENTCDKNNHTYANIGVQDGRKYNQITPSNVRNIHTDINNGNIKSEKYHDNDRTSIGIITRFRKTNTIINNHCESDNSNNNHNGIECNGSIASKSIHKTLTNNSDSTNNINSNDRPTNENTNITRLNIKAEIRNMMKEIELIKKMTEELLK